MTSPEIPKPEFKLKPEGVRAFQDRLKDDNYRKAFAAFFLAKRVVDLPYDPLTPEGLHDVAWLAIDDFTTLTRAAHSDGWPEDVKPVEEFFKAAEDMDRRDYD